MSNSSIFTTDPGDGHEVVVSAGPAPYPVPFGWASLDLSVEPPHLYDPASIFGPAESDSIHEKTVCIR